MQLNTAKSFRAECPDGITGWMTGWQTMLNLHRSRSLSIRLATDCEARSVYLRPTTYLANLTPYI